MSDRFTIVGAGLAGTLMGVYLAQKGARVELYERRGDMRKEATPRGRSINLALSTRGLAALGEVGIAGEILKLAVPMKGRMIHGSDRSLAFQPYSANPDEMLYSVSRQGLNSALMDLAERHSGVKIHFRHKCAGVDLREKKIQLEDEAAGEKKIVEGGIVIGGDGAHSAVRREMQKLDRFQYHQDFLEWGYKELSIPAGQNGAFPIEKNALHIWPRRDFMLIALPNAGGSFTCTVFLPFRGPFGFEQLQTDDRISKFFADQFPDAVPLMPTLLDDFKHNPTSSLVYIRCFPWHLGGHAVLIGDACHAVVPFYGQGMNAAFEDCSVLSRSLADHSDPEAAFEDYEKKRKPNADALADLSLGNFVEMRDKVASRSFLLRKKVEKILHRLFPARFIPLYSMVTFSTIPYAEAVERAKKQDKILEAGAAFVAGVLVLILLLIFFR